jgi:hypothetical protein
MSAREKQEVGIVSANAWLHKTILPAHFSTWLALNKPMPEQQLKADDVEVNGPVHQNQTARASMGN